MKKIILLLICLFSLTACGNKLYKEKEKEVLNSNFITIEENIKRLNDRLIMFPDSNTEDELITYLLVIRNNKDRFNNEELKDIQLTVTNDYQYELNSLGYDREEVTKIINELKKEQS
jgi:hypothetical protein